MKNLKFPLILLMFIGAINLQGQTPTYYGWNAGTGGSYNSFFGQYAGSATTGNYNTASGAFSLYYNTIGQRNVAMGYSAMRSNTTGSYNVGIGMNSLYSNNTGYNNTGIGYYALRKNEGGHNNFAAGYRALHSNIGGDYNTATGSDAMYSNTSGNYNTATGVSALRDNTTGDYNIATGVDALYWNLTGSANVAMGYKALEDNTSGSYNVSVGHRALSNNETGQRNVAIGYNSSSVQKSGYNNTTIGYNAGQTNNSFTYSNSTAIGANTTIVGNNEVRIGNNDIVSIKGNVPFTTYSDGRFKREVKEDVLGLDFIKALRPVSYYVDGNALNEFLGVELDGDQGTSEKRYQTGFIAQEVEKTAEKLGFKHFNGVDAPQSKENHYGLRYAAFVVPLVKSVQELSAENEDQKATIESLKEAIAQQQIQINQLLNQANTTLEVDGINGENKAALYQNTPNPFTNETQIKLFVPQEAGHALIQVCTIKGKQLFVKEVTGREETSIVLKGNDLPAGIYMYTLIVDNEIITSKRMVLTK